VKNKHVAVLMGGWSSERPVSLASGAACADGLEAAGYSVTRIDMDRDIARVLAELRPDAVFNALHGPFGEDGTIQGVLEILGIPYTHSGILASALALNKHKAKHVAAAAGLPVAEHHIVSNVAAAERHVLPPPYVIKPIAEGSSFGVIIVREGQGHPPQSLLGEEWTYGVEVMVERFVPGRELTCAVMGEDALAVTEIAPIGHEFYDYDAKYAAGGSKHLVPAPLDASVYERVCTLAVQAHQAMGCRGISRSDFRYDDRTGELIWLEVNTQPGMTRTSLAPEQAQYRGISFPELVAWLVEDASCRR
jgi:D-alanine-D-alanine ligase